MSVPKIIRISVIIFSVLLLSYSGLAYWRSRQLLKINSFELCRAAGFPVMESFPEVCRTSDGRSFVRQLQNQLITVSGELVCLPHRDSVGPQTLECAYGLRQTSSGLYYSLSDPAMIFLNRLSANHLITVTGYLTTPGSDKYDTVGMITVSSLDSDEN